VNVFACKALGCRLTVSACAKRVRASREAGNSFKGAGLMSGDCRSCAVGREHQLGREPAHWPDGSPVVRLRLASAAPMAAEKPAPVEVPVVPGLLVTKAEAKRKREHKPKPASAKPATTRLRHSTVEEYRQAKREAQRRWAERKRRERGAKEMVEPTVYTWGSRTLTAYGWARAPEAIGLNHEVVRARLREGWDVESAITTPVNGKRPKYTFGDRTLSLAEWAREPDVAALSLSSDALGARLRLGWSLERALTTPRDDSNVRCRRRAAGSDMSAPVDVRKSGNHECMPEHGSEQRKGASS
jgi:hypothetical protein